MAKRFNSKRRIESEYYAKPKTTGGKKSNEPKPKPVKKAVKQEKVPPKLVREAHEIYNQLYNQGAKNKEQHTKVKEKSVERYDLLFVCGENYKSIILSC